MFSLHRILIYSGFGLGRFHGIRINDLWLINITMLAAKLKIEWKVSIKLNQMRLRFSCKENTIVKTSNREKYWIIVETERNLELNNKELKYRTIDTKYVEREITLINHYIQVCTIYL